MSKISSTRFLSKESKTQELNSFNTLRLTQPPPGNQNGHGYPDPEILPLCDWINKHPGMCTLQSCTGHPPRIGHGASSGTKSPILGKAQKSGLLHPRRGPLLHVPQYCY